MYDYVTAELPALVEGNLPLQPGVKSVSGHSMGGHGALICALKNPDAFRSVSAFAPITNPVNCGWGKGCFGAYLGDDSESWEAYDATCLIAGGARVSDILIDQGPNARSIQIELPARGQELNDELERFEAPGRAVVLILRDRREPGELFVDEVLIALF